MLSKLLSVGLEPEMKAVDKLKIDLNIKAPQYLGHGARHRAIADAVQGFLAVTVTTVFATHMVSTG
jgi:hypothetical protein